MGCCCSSPSEKHSERDRGRQSTADGPSSGQRRRKPGEKARYIVQWDYTAASKSELNLTKGEILQSEMEECDAGPEWVFVSKVGKDGTGYAPRAHVAELGSMDMEAWFFGEIKREQADRILEGLPDGMFLVRTRTTPAGVTYALSVAYNNMAKHYRVKTAREGGGIMYLLAKRKFETIPQMIDCFRRPNPDCCCPLIGSPPKSEPERIDLPADVQKQWQEIPRSQIQIEQELGKGHFGVVKKGVWKPTANIALEVAVKELKKGTTETRAEFLKEALAMKNLIHERLVKLYGVVSKEEPYWIVTEFVKNGALRTYLRKRDKAQEWLPEPKLVEISCQVADGMRYLESKNFVHRDLAARNILVSETPGETIKETEISVKVGDLGMAAMMKGGKVKEKHRMQLAVKWTAPEALRELRFSSASDVWSFGILLHEIFTHGGEPYKGKPPARVQAELLREQRFSLDRAESVPEKIFDLMCACCQFNHLHRVTFQDIYDSLDNYYAKGIDPYERYRQ